MIVGGFICCVGVYLAVITRNMVVPGYDAAEDITQRRFLLGRQTVIITGLVCIVLGLIVIAGGLIGLF
jgi:hypothetical protein